MAFKIQKIKDLIKLKKITRKEFSNLLEVSEPTVINYLNGRTKIDVTLIDRIAKVLNVPVSYFFDETPSNKASDNKEFDNFLNESIKQSELSLINLSGVAENLLFELNCKLNNDFNLFDVKTTFLHGLNTISQLRIKYLFEDKKISDNYAMITTFTDFSIKDKMKYIDKISDVNLYLSEITHKLLNEYRYQLDKGKEYKKGKRIECYKKFINMIK